MNWIKRFFAFVLLLAALLISAFYFLTWKYSDDLKQYAIESVREVIITELEFDENVGVSFWTDFPLVAVEINDVKVQDSFKTDTLLNLEKAFVQFNVIRLIQNDISIEGIRFTDGFIRLRRNASDSWNFRVWKQPESGGEKKIDFSIEVLVLENVFLDYDDRMIDLNVQFKSDKSKLKGRFTNDNQRLGLSLTGFLRSLTTVGSQRIKDLPLSLVGVLNINNKDKIYTIETGNAVLAGNEMVLNAEWTKIESGTNMQMQVHAGNIEPSTILPLVWPQVPENITNLNLTGKSDVIFTLNGPFTLSSGPTLEATIRMRDGGIVFQQTNVSDLNFEGKLFMKDIKRSKAMKLKFDSFELNTPKGNVQGKGTLTDLTNPYLEIQATGKSNLDELTTVANIKDNVAASGAISWDIVFSGPLGNDFNTTVNELRQMDWSGKLSLENTNLKFNTGIPELRDFTANISMNQGKTVITQCNGKLGHLAFDGEASIAQLKNILTEETAPVNVTANIHVAELDVVKLPNEWEFESESSSRQPREITLDVTGKFDKLVYNQFTASNVQGKIKMMNNLVRVSNLRFDALGGSVRSDLSYSPNANGSLLKIDADLRSIDMSRTLKEWDDFGQTTITSSNLKGTANTSLQADIYLDNRLNIISNKLNVDADVEISGGELIEFEPLLAMSRFIDVDELNRVKFDTLRNSLSIRDSKLTIPKMTVSSSILNVDVFGEHGFDLEMDYHVNLLLNDLLRRKQKKTKTFDGHEIVDEKGKTRLFLWIRGKPGDLKVGFDKREVRKKIKEDFKKEGQTIKQLFKEEFGSGEPASTTELEENVEFRLEDNGIFEEPNQQAETPEHKQQEKPKKKKGLFSTEPDEEETEGGFEIEFDP